jgi:phage baseplate assembly protein gpV
MIESKVTAFAGRKDSKVAGAFDKPKMLLNRSDLGSVAETKATAQAVIDRANEHNLQAEGRCWGDVKLAVDKEVTIKGVNQRFDGKYRISHLRHTFTHEQGFVTEFACRGLADQSLSALVSETANGFASSAPDRGVFDGVTVGIVTDNKDPDGLGRVKVKIPTLADDTNTGWMRMAFPGGGGKGDHHGWYLLPEVEDEVLVIFEQGDARRGYVLGGLLNGQEKPKYQNSTVLGSGNVVNQHAFRLKSGGHLLFDEKDGEEKIELKNKDGKLTFLLEEKNGITLKNELNNTKVLISNTGEISIIAEQKDISIEAKAGKLSLKAAQDISIESSGGKVAIKAAQDATIDGLNVKATGQVNAEVKGNVQGKIEGGATAVVKGAMVMIN